jgi:hypothetical protein
MVGRIRRLRDKTRQDETRRRGAIPVPPDGKWWSMAIRTMEVHRLAPYGAEHRIIALECTYVPYVWLDGWMDRWMMDG